MKRSFCLVAAALSAGVAVACSTYVVGKGVFPLEWNPTFRTDVPYEVEISAEKLTRLAAVPPGTGYEVRADGHPVDATFLRGKAPGTVLVRFRVPAGTRSLTCSAGVGKLRLADSATVENVFAGALGDAKRWTDVPKKGTRFVKTRIADGIRLVNDGASGFVRCEADVPDALRGQPVKFELDVKNVAKAVWSGYINLRQYDAEGKEISELVSDPRWTSHMRPVGKLTAYRENGRIHPAARKVALEIELRHAEAAFDPYGEPVRDASVFVPALEVTHLALRPADVLPFPKYADEFFPAGVTDDPADRAIRLGGEKAFWYATRSKAAWTDGKQVRDGAEAFFPTEAGTMEAYFKADRLDDRFEYPIFEASGNYISSVYTLPAGPKNLPPELRGVFVEVHYLPAKERVEVVMKDAATEIFRGGGDWEMPVGRWVHIAFCWEPDGEAAFFADGVRVFSFPLRGYRPFDLTKGPKPNESGALECYLGSTWKLARKLPMPHFMTPHGDWSDNAKYRFLDCAADEFRVSSCVRYRGAFAPAKRLGCDADTRAYFSFDRSFDGVSGGGSRFVSGTVRELHDRVDHRLAIGGKDVWYFPETLAPENDPANVLKGENYPVVPDDDDFRTAWTRRTATAKLTAGGTLDVTAAAGSVADYVEIANRGSGPLVHPLLVNAGEIDPRSYGDIADSLKASGDVSDREKANRLFQFFLGASDYFMIHSATFPADSDVPQGAAGSPMLILNGYCGFECGPLNNVAATTFACGGGLPASQSAGYGHSFQQVFYDGKNHVYDLSAKMFFPSLDNETVEYLEEVDRQPGSHHRLGKAVNTFMRLTTRGAQAWTPVYFRKAAFALRPGETFRAWYVNDGNVNDVCLNAQYPGNHREAPLNVDPKDVKPFRRDVIAETHADVSGKDGLGRPNVLERINRFFPHIANAFLTYEGVPSGGVYRVESCYPVVAGRYRARLSDGTSAKLSIRTDGRTWRPLPAGTDGWTELVYEVRARSGYDIRIEAEADAVASFRAETELQVNPRLLCGRVRPGANSFTFKAANGAAADVKVGWREKAKEIVFEGTLRYGVVSGCEKELVIVDPAKTAASVRVIGASSAAEVTATDGLVAKLAGDVLTVGADAGRKNGIGWVTLRDGAAEKHLAVLVCRGARVARPKSGVARLFRAGESLTLDLEAPEPVSQCVWSLVRWPAHATDYGYARPLKVRIGEVERDASGPLNLAFNFYRSEYGRKGGRSAWKWDQVFDDRSYYCHLLIGEFALGQATSATYSLSEDVPQGVEVQALVVLPYPDFDFAADLKKLLGGYNFAPWIMFAAGGR